MKISILTLPLEENFGGGLLQAYALQTVLRRLGHEVRIVNRCRRRFNPRPALSCIKRALNRFASREEIIVRIYPTKKERKIISQHTTCFINEHLHMTEKIYTSNAMRVLKKQGFDMYIVGSDQVWRPSFTPDINDYFLAFLKKSGVEKRVAYAASFGVDKYMFTPKQTEKFRELIKLFDALSVREDSAVNLMRENFGVLAELVLDPTFLLTKKDYLNLAQIDEPDSRKGLLMTYVLDNTAEKNGIIEKIAADTKLLPRNVLQQHKFSEVGRRGIERCIFTSVKDWIIGFNDADFIITDSYHGTIFSIIFNKQFIAIGNRDRGLSRFESLLNMFDLKDRLIVQPGDYHPGLCERQIDYSKVNQFMEAAQKRSYDFLKKAIS